MRAIISIVVALWCLPLFSANPPWSALSWTNSANFIWPKGEPAPDPAGLLIGPSMFFRKDGGIFIGTNVTQDIGVSDLTRSLPFYAVSFTDSNEPPTGAMTVGSLDSENYRNYANFNWSWDNNKDIANAAFDVTAHLTNGTDYVADIFMDPGDGGAFSGFRLRTNFHVVFFADANGTVTSLKTVSTNGVASFSTQAGSSLDAKGITNTFGINAGAYVTATAVAFTVKNRANATIYTSPTLTATIYVHLEPGWSVNAASGLAGTLLPE